MSHDLEGNLVREGDIVYICDAAQRGSKSKRMLRGEVMSISKSGKMCQVYVPESKRYYNKQVSCIVKPRMD